MDAKGESLTTALAAPTEKRQKPRRGRPSREQERAITESIVQAGLRLFLADGYGATSMKRIGEEAGVAPNTLYARFPDKASLFRSLIEWKAASWKMAHPPRRPRAGAGLVEILETGALGMLEGVDREDIRALSRLLLLEADRFPELSRIYHDNAMIIGRDEFVDRIRNAPDADLTEEQVLDLATTLQEVVVGHARAKTFQDPAHRPISRRQVARRIASVIGRGFTRI